ncbi:MULTISPECIES: hypothetical protein [unclassified Janthinobacterium]|uniref:hypothetical protein n=1 Tax=unclassified Janthinobacterium TaxID=2610881 RepID=UPI00088715D1|nr:MULTISPECIES: hypothetical protein [unclassified Janthinobacterium]SDA53941.1 hypothetical protein SAMN03159349_01653 [Janthinobacterium sp. 551a]SFB45290.1 hypothetical protein SAMN03159300_1056 [Janthinobacterium sp. 344]
MIRYAIAPAALIDAINIKKPSWLRRADERTEQYRKQGAYGDGSEFWGEIKEVYIALQGEKCAYCETKLAGITYASKVHEVEHFRPKSRVRAWPGTLPRLTAYVPPCATGAASAGGYHLLAYNPFNYAIACTRCNSSLKSDYFPVRANRLFSEQDPGKLLIEEPLLIYPISDFDIDPESVITFVGVQAVPRYKQGAHYQRARITIDFFDLNHEDLTTRRAEVIGGLYVALLAMDLYPAKGKVFQEQIDLLIGPKSCFSACGKAYLALWETDVVLAEQLGEAAQALRPR